MISGEPATAERRRAVVRAAIEDGTTVGSRRIPVSGKVVDQGRGGSTARAKICEQVTATTGGPAASVTRRRSGDVVERRDGSAAAEGRRRGCPSTVATSLPTGLIGSPSESCRAGVRAGADELSPTGRRRQPANPAAQLSAGRPPSAGTLSRAVWSVP